MFADFNKAFDKKKSLDIIPEPIIKALSVNLPDGFKYIQIDNQMCTVVPENDDIKLSFDFIKENEFNAKSPQELLEYLYRTQKELKIDSNVITMNGQSFSINEILKYPLKDINFDKKSTQVVIKPGLFPEPFELSIGYEEGSYKKIKFQRQPYADLNKSLFKSIDTKFMEISFIVDEVNKSMNMNLKIRLPKAENIEEIIIAAKMYRNFTNGKLIIGDNVIEGNMKSENIDNNFLELIDFWEKVYELSKYLNIKFEPKENLSKEDVSIINALFRSFIENVDFEEFVDATSFIMTANEKIDIDKFNFTEDIMIQFVENKEHFILGKKVKLYSVITLSNFKFQKILANEKNPLDYEIEVKPSSDIGISRKIRFFRNENEIDLYRKHLNKL